MPEQISQLDPGSSEPLPTGWRAPGALLLLALPIIASMISRTVMSFVDFIMVSQLGTTAQAAIMPAGILLFCVTAFGFGMLIPVSTFVSQSLGRGERRACGAYAWQGVHLSLVVAVLALPAWLVVPALFAWVGHEPAVQAMEVSYVQIGLIGIAPVLAAAAVANFFNGIHRPMIGFWAMLVSNLFNVLANYALIFGNLGFPAMGIAGAAWGTNAAAALQLLIVITWMLRPRLAELYHTRRGWRIDLPRMRSVAWLGLPSAVQHLGDILAFTIFTLLLVGRFGTEQLAAHNVTFKFLEVAFMPAVGLGMALTAAVGKAIGLGRPDYARLLTRWATAFAVVYMGLIALGYVTFGRQLAGLLSDDPAVVEWAAKLLLLCAVFQIFDAVGIVHIHALRGAGDAHWPAIVSATLAGVLLVAGGYLIAWQWPQLGALGPWIAATIYIIILGLTLWARWSRGPWERLDLFNTPTPRTPASPLCPDPNPTQTEPKQV